MFTIRRNKSLPATLRTRTFQSYEEARRAIRAWLRTRTPGIGNPAISDHGFRVERLAT